MHISMFLKLIVFCLIHCNIAFCLVFVHILHVYNIIYCVNFHLTRAPISMFQVNVLFNTVEPPIVDPPN